MHECSGIAATEDDGFGFGSMDFKECEVYACEEHSRCDEYAKVTVQSSQLAHTSRKKTKLKKARTPSTG